MALFLSNTVTKCPTLFSWCAAARPAGPEPITAILFPVRCLGNSGFIQPCSNAWSMMAHSMFLMVTGLALMPRTQAPSHGAGHTRPVNSGKLFV
ncbi:urease accessory [Brachionus plicatilis]|uniref:Urease accessory n=1 Tax=Brachionus plicatilis TaxID=10195 RepID=A0A3M7SI14_BRAPC|nr:urease accessory [Brachionus plicatilis]